MFRAIDRLWSMARVDVPIVVSELERSLKTEIGGERHPSPFLLRLFCLVQSLSYCTQEALEGRRHQRSHGIRRSGTRKPCLPLLSNHAHCLRSSNRFQGLDAPAVLADALQITMSRRSMSYSSHPARDDGNGSVEAEAWLVPEFLVLNCLDERHEGNRGTRALIEKHHSFGH